MRFVSTFEALKGVTILKRLIYFSSVLTVLEFVLH